MTPGPVSGAAGDARPAAPAASSNAHAAATLPAKAPSAPALWLIPLVYFLFVAGEFAAMTHLALSLTQAGRSALAVGVMGSALWLGLFAASTQAHVVVTRFGHAPVVLWATVASTLALATLKLHDSYTGWLAGALVLGLGGGLVWVAGEAWLAEIAPAAQRGLYVGLFETSVGLAMVAGPALLPLALWLGTSPLWLALASMVGATLACVLLRREPAPSPHDQTIVHDPHAPPSARPEWRRIALPLVWVAAIAGLMESGVSALLPSISVRLGFDVSTAAWLGAVIGAGSALMQPPFGMLADRFGLPRCMALAWGLIACAAAAMAWWAASPGHVLWVAGFALGGVGGAVYTLVVIELGHRLVGGGLVKAMGLLVTGYTGGTAFGPVLGGALFDAAGLAGLALALLGWSGVGAALAWQGLRGQPAAAALRGST
jgi:MFS family permease